MHIYTICPSQLQSFTKFCWVVSEWLTTKKRLTNWLQRLINSKNRKNASKIDEKNFQSIWKFQVHIFRWWVVSACTGTNFQKYPCTHFLQHAWQNHVHKRGTDGWTGWNQYTCTPQTLFGGGCIKIDNQNNWNKTKIT